MRQPRPAYRAVRRTLEFSEEERDLIEFIAERDKSNTTAVIRKAIRLLGLIEKRRALGARMFIERDGALVELEVL